MTNNSKFIYTIYIKATPEIIWSAITNPHLTLQYWGNKNISDWKKGSYWQHVANDNKCTIKLAGKVLEVIPMKLLSLTWVDPNNFADASFVTFKIIHLKDNEVVRIRLIHNNFKDGSKMFDRIKVGWPRVLSSMKSFLESGQPLITWDKNLI